MTSSDTTRTAYLLEHVMVIDTSALIAILTLEQDARYFAEAIQQDPRRLLSSASLVEAAIVITARHGEEAGRELDLLIEQANIQIMAVTAEQAAAARQAHRIYGKRRHPAALNFGDCFTYALAKVEREPVLCKGNDFVQTDLRVWAPTESR